MLDDQLVIIQSTPFCNIRCKYCYLPDRSNTARASEEVLAAIFRQTLSSTLIRDPLTFVWHAGEPLSLPSAYYDRAFRLANEVNARYGRRYKHAIQTNGMLINSDYVELFRAFDVQLGISIDGPAFVHDHQRVTRAGKGTHEQVMRGIGQLRAAGLGFGAIAVLTRFSLDHPDAIFDFFESEHISHVAFNMDEILSTHMSTSYSVNDAAEAYRRFMRRFLARVKASGGRMIIREFRQIYEQVLDRQAGGDGIVNSTNTPMRIVNFDHRGNYWTFSPELNGASSPRYGEIVMGNVLTDRLDDIVSHPKYRLIADEIAKGVAQCRATCSHWSVCGGGSPAAKFFEHGRFDVTETYSCRINVKALTEVVLEHLEAELGLERRTSTDERC